MLAELAPAASELTSFGMAGLMGAMWLWERRSSRHREEQLDEAHGRILADRVQLEELIDLVRQNVAAMTRLADVQEELLRGIRRPAAAAGQPTGPDGAEGRRP